MRSFSDLHNLDGKIALVTGAAGKLGSTISLTLAELGADLILIDRPDSALQDISDQLMHKHNKKSKIYFCNLEDENSRTQLIESVSMDFVKLDILVNNAAFVGDSKLKGWSVQLQEQTLETWRRALEVNLTTPFHLIQKLTPLLLMGASPCILNIGSIYGELAPDWSLYEGTTMNNPGAYSASKAGLLQITKWYSTLLAPDIRVNALCPGGILRGQPEIFIERYKKKTPLGRMATEDDFRGAVAFLTTDLSIYVTGQILTVDGGWGAW